MRIIAFTGLVLLIAFSACVSKKKYTTQVREYDTLKMDYDKLKMQLGLCSTDKDNQAKTIEQMEKELADLKLHGNTMLKQLSDLSVITVAQSESIKKSLENINSKDAYINVLQKEMSRKDSMNMALVLNLKGALKDINDEDVEINVEGSAVFISISDKLLFKSGSYEVTTRAREVLGKVAAVLKAQPGIQFMVEGHTDNQPISTTYIKDNWDLSVLRSTAVVRVLQRNYGIEPNRMIAAGRSEYVSVSSNSTEKGRAMNRRTRIVIIPQLDQFFKLLEPK